MAQRDKFKELPKMGMAASQARLLLLTSRIHDVELKAQQLQNAKIQLATQQDEIYEEYQKALDATTLTFATINNGVQSSIAANYNNLFSVNAANAANGSHFCLIDSRGRVVVSDDLYDAYYDYVDNGYGLDNAYAFAAWMLSSGGGGAGLGNWSMQDLINRAQEVYDEKSETDTTLADLYSKATTGRGREAGAGGGPGEFAPTPTGGDTLLGEPLTGGTNQLPTLDSDSDNDIDIDTDTDTDNDDPDEPNPWVVPINLHSVTVHVNNNQPADKGAGPNGNGGKPGFGTLVTGGKGGVPDRGRGSSVPDRAGNADSSARIPVSGGSGSGSGTTITETNAGNPTGNTPSVTDPGQGGGYNYIPRSGNLEGIFRGTTGYPEFCQQFLNYFFNRYGSLIFRADNIPDEDYDRFNYYVRMYSAIQQHGGCISINEFNGPSGDAATNSEWLTNMIQSGQLTIESFHTDETGMVTTTGTTVATEPSLSYTANTQLDRTALAKAEAAYEHAMKVIDRKEQKIDRELNKIETERSALTKQYDSIKKVIDDNIDRTFGIFS